MLLKILPDLVEAATTTHQYQFFSRSILKFGKA